MKKYIGLILFTLIFQLPVDAGFDPSAMNPQSQVHNAHIGIEAANLNCDTCHGFPANVVKVNEMGTKPGEYIVCENCHAAPPNSFNPSMGNLIVIHLSRGLYCTNCHDTTKITPTHPSTKAENGTVQVIKCENCHVNPQNSISHVNGGKYCLDCHGNKTTPLIIAVSPTSTPLVIPVSTYVTSATRVRILIDSQRGFVPATQTIKAGDEIIWRNGGTATITLVSSDGLFDNQLLGFDKEYRYAFNKPGTYSFYLNENKNLKGTIVVESAATYTPTLTPASTITPVPTVPTVKQRAQLQVTYEIGAGKTKQELTVSVRLKNTGNATASKVNLTINNPPELEAAVLSGSDKIGGTIAWNGDIPPGEEHIVQYSVRIVAGKSIEVPLKVTYAKISPDEKAKALGMMSTSAASEQLLAPEDIEVISLIIKIAAAAMPGFEAALAMVLLLLVYVISRNRK